MAWQELCALVRERADALQVPGAAVGPVAGGEERTSGLGDTSIENPLSVTPETLVAKL